MDNSKKYPIGRFSCPKSVSEILLNSWIDVLEEFPEKLEALTIHLNQEQLDTPYRMDGWTVRQVIHHCADSHHNSYTRFKWTLTENQPIIKPYYEERWAALFDSKSAPITLSITYLKALHAKWTYLLKGLHSSELDNYFIHPENDRKINLKECIGLYAWHCNHHYMHIYNLLVEKKWLNSKSEL